jgi:hypothetical protein
MKRNVENHYGAFLVNGALVQSDWDFPATARGLGWSLSRVQKRAGSVQHLARRPTRADACQHRGTDGTIDCRECGVLASDFIAAASDFLSGLAF